MIDDELPPAKIVTLMQDENGHLEILPDADVSKFECLGMLQIAYARQYADVHDEEVDAGAWEYEGEEDE